MSQNTQINTESTTSEAVKAAEQVVSDPVVKSAVLTKSKSVTPMAYRMTVRPRESVKQHFDNLKPDGNPRPELVSIAMDVVSKLVDLHPAEYQGMEVVVEIGGGLAHQINIIVIPHKW